MSNTKICAHCEYFVIDEKVTELPRTGQCRRFPPVPMLLPSPGVVNAHGTGPALGMGSVSPQVPDDYTCGEFLSTEIAAVIERARSGGTV